MRYKRRRLVVKACIWELISFTILWSLAYIFTGKWEVVTLLAVLYHVIKITPYCLYDKHWHGVKWGIIDD